MEPNARDTAARAPAGGSIDYAPDAAARALARVGIVVTPTAVRCGERSFARAHIHGLAVRERYGKKWCGVALVCFGVAVVPLVIFLPCMSMIALVSVIVGGALAVHAQPGGHALMLRTRRGEREVARFREAERADELYQTLLQKLELPRNR